MTFADKCALSCYERVAVLSESHGVYLVQHTGSKRIYVMKKLSVYDRAVFSRLKDAQLEGVPRIAELIEDGDGLIVIEEYVGGRTIRSVLDDGGRFSERDAVRITVRLCGILAGLHGAKPPIVHRDIKPSNVILTPDGGVLLIDMNAAKQYRAGRSEDTELIGTVGYAAPEQYGFGASDVRADIYALGVLLNEMLLGVPPKTALPEGRLGKVIKKCTMLDPKDRYPSVEALERELGVELSADRDAVSSGARRFMPPGFRTRNPSNMTAAILGYTLIILLGLTLTSDGGAYGASVWVERLFFVVSCLAVVFIDFNYLGVWRALRIDRIKSTALKTLVLIALDVATVAALLLTMTIIASFVGVSPA